MFDGEEGLNLRREQTEPTAKIKLRSVEHSLEPKPALSSGDQSNGEHVFEYFSQGNLNDLTFQYSNPNGSEDASPPVINLSTQNHSQVS